MSKNPPANAGDMGSIQCLVQEDSTGHAATKPMHHHYRALALQILKATMHLEPVLRNKRSHCNEKPMHCEEE